MKDPGDRNYESSFDVFRAAISRCSIVRQGQVAGLIKKGLNPALKEKFRKKNGKLPPIDEAWGSYLALVRTFLPRYVEYSLTDASDDSARRIGRLRAGWGPESAGRPETAEAAYFYAHVCDDRNLNNAAKYIDQTVLGASFRNIFETEVPVDEETAKQLEEKFDQILSANANRKKQHSTTEILKSHKTFHQEKESHETSIIHFKTLFSPSKSSDLPLTSDTPRIPNHGYLKKIPGEHILRKNEFISLERIDRHWNQGIPFAAAM